MSKQIALATQRREGSGKGVTRRLRRSGRVPAVAYGTALEPVALSVDALELYHALHTDAGLNAVIRLDIDGQPQLALVREVQRHPVRREILHVDFLTVSRDAVVSMDIPLVLEGVPAGVEEGGIVAQELHTLSLQVRALAAPDQLALDISGMHIGDVRRAGDVPLPEGTTLLTDADASVVSVTVPTMAEAATTETLESDEVAEAEAEGATAQEAGEDLEPGQSQE